jgi:acetyl esterase/lipase
MVLQGYKKPATKSRKRYNHPECIHVTSRPRLSARNLAYRQHASTLIVRSPQFLVSEFMKLTVLLALVLSTTLYAIEPFPGGMADFNGVTRSTLPLGQDQATVLCPTKPGPGRPWVLMQSLAGLDDAARADLTRLALELVKQRGFHVIAIALGTADGKGDRSANWDAAYKAVTDKYSLAKQCVMIGQGDDAQAIGDWAASRSGKVSCIYLEQAMISPSLLPKLAASKVAIIVGSSAADAGQAAELRQCYDSLGGTCKVISSGGAQAGIAPVVNFITYHAYGNPEPTLQAVSYGPHPKQVIDFWKAPSDRPSPVAVYIHGGGWSGGSRVDAARVVDFLKAGISVAAVEYRFIAEATADGVKPPVKGPMSDVARAVQFIRSKAGEWNLRKDRLGAWGGSAGGCSSLWLAFHPDLADPASADPVARESTRLFCVAAIIPQTSLDPRQMKEWTPNIAYGAHAFGIQGDRSKKLTGFDAFLAQRETILPWIAEFSPYALATSSAPPVYLYANSVPELGKAQKDATHSANFCLMLQQRLTELKVECEFVHPGAPSLQHPSAPDYLIHRLKTP